MHNVVLSACTYNESKNSMVFIMRQNTVHAEHDIVMANPSVCLSVCPAIQCRTVSKRMDMSLCLT